MKGLSILLTGIVTIFSAQAQSTGSVSGTITDIHSEAIPGASVHVLNTNFGAITDSGGNFTIQAPAGTYSVQITAVGYASVEKTIVIAPSGSERLLVQLAQTSTQLDDVIVTAQKKEEVLQSIPASITSLSSRQVQEYRLWNSKDLTAIVPNLYSSNPGDNRNVTSIRGITSTSYDPAVATYIDGVNQFGLDTYIAQLFDVERIEVLRGPQGTLYGRNAMGGVINIITKQPSRTTDGFAEINFGTYGQQRYSGGVRTPLVKDKLFLGISGVYDRMDGFYTNQFYNSKFDRKSSLIGNYYLHYLAGSRWTFTFNLKHNENRNNGAFPLASSVTKALQNPYQVNQNAATTMIDNIFNSSLSILYHGSHFNFTSQSAYQSNYRYYQSPIDGDFSPKDIVTIINNYGKKWNNTKVLTQELRFTSPAASRSPLLWTAGTYLFYQENPVKQATRFGKDAALYGIPDSMFSLIGTSKGKSTGAALFGQATYRVSDHFDFIGGLRYDYEHKKQSVMGEYQHDPNPDPIFATRPDTTATISFHAFSPKLGATWRATENQTLFVTYSRGYRTGGFTSLSSDPSQPPLRGYRPEYSGNAELGIKNMFLNNQLRVNFTLFYVTITDAQVPTLILPDAITITKNAGKLTSKGMELELSATPVKGVTIEYNAGVTNARYNTLALSQNGSAVDLAGKRQLFTPDATSMLALQYGIGIGGKKQWKAVARGEWMYLGKKYFDLANTIDQPSYSLLNARFGVAVSGFEIMFWGRNLTNKRYIDYAYDFGAAHLGNPRNYGVTLRKNF
jgi:iron complex outermembrane receptor protein